MKNIYSSTMKNSLVIIIFPDMMKKYLISFIVVSFISIIACFLAMPDNVFLCSKLMLRR